MLWPELWLCQRRGRANHSDGVGRFQLKTLFATGPNPITLFATRANASLYYINIYDKERKT